jgi:hypothetical protein
MHIAHRDILDRLQSLRKEEKRLLTTKSGEMEELEKQLFDLEAQMNALISSAAAIREVPDDHHSNLLRVVASAIGKHGRVAESAEVAETQLKNVTERATRLGKRVL